MNCACFVSMPSGTHHFSVCGLVPVIVIATTSAESSWPHGDEASAVARQQVEAGDALPAHQLVHVAVRALERDADGRHLDPERQ